jgi:hypothetical protein
LTLPHMIVSHRMSEIVPPGETLQRRTERLLERSLNDDLGYRAPV